tara:strand:+ start:5402 stop:6178 length:777 start_codon:yes stop_codon:yes gene_type:complete
MKVKPNNLRKHVLDMIHDKQSGHIGGSFSLAEVVSYLYNNYNLIEDNKDKLILSKGHAVPILYAALYEMGLIDTLDDFREVNSQLQGHPDKTRLKYMHATTGALGQGLSIGIGHALAYRLKSAISKVFCILGDGEIQEGQVWEAFMLAPKYNLDNLYCIIDHNKSQNDGFVEDILSLGDLESKVSSFGWNVIRIDGHDMIQIEDAFSVEPNGRPTCVLMDTVKGNGVEFMQTPEWHAKAPSDEEYEKAIKDLRYESNS